MKKKFEAKKKIGTALLVLTMMVAGLGALAPAALAQSEGAGKEGGLPPELQEYEGRIHEALALLKEPLERVRALAGDLKDSKGVVRDALSEKGEGAVEAFAGELRTYARDARDVSRHLGRARSGASGFRGLRRRVTRAVRDGDTEKAIEMIEDALSRVDEAKAGLEHLASDIEALLAEQAGLVDAINAWSEQVR